MPDPKNPPALSHYVSVFQVANIQRSILFYTVRLGFTVTFEWGEPVDYVIIQRDQIKIHLAENKTLKAHTGSPRSVYVFATEINQLYADFKATGLHNITCLLYTSPSPRDRG